MCYSKSQRADDNRRCDAHKFGTLASVEMTSYVGNVPQKFVEQTNKELRNEGKGLPNPSQEEVDQFVSTQAFIGQHDPSIPDNRRKTIVERWRKARNEKPSGGLMHAWKNSLTESVVRYRRTAVASVMAASVLATSACGSTPPRDENPAPAPEVTVTAPANPSENATPTPTESAKPTQTDDNLTTGINRLNNQGVKVKGKVDVKEGSYPQYNVTKDSAIAKFDSSKHTGGTPKGWEKADLAKSQVAAGNYMMNVVLDNPTLNNYDANKGKFEEILNKSVDPKYRKVYIASLSDKSQGQFVNDTFQDGSFAGDTTKGFRYVSDGKTPRISDISGLKVKSSQVWEGDVYYEYEGNVTMNVVDKDNKPYTMTRGITYGLTISKKGDKFFISGTNFENGQYMNPEPVN